LVEHLARALEADHAFIAELMVENLDRVRTIAVCAHGQIVANFEYDLPTPLADRLKRGDAYETLFCGGRLLNGPAYYVA
jgi:hypothetical protein